MKMISKERGCYFFILLVRSDSGEELGKGNVAEGNFDQ